MLFFRKAKKIYVRSPKGFFTLWGEAILVKKRKLIEAKKNL